MLKLLLQFWPVWAPVVVYLLWWRLRVHRARKENEIAPGIADGPWVWTAAATLAIAVVMFLWLGLAGGGQDADTPYKPARTENGIIVR